MTQFEYQRGTISIGDERLEIDGSSREALEIWYRERKSTVVLLALAVVVVGVMGIFDIGPLTRPLIAGFAFFVFVLFAEFVLKHLGIVENRTRIPRQQITKATYEPMGRIKPSKLTIHYRDGEDEAKTHTRTVRLANPIMSSTDRTTPAIEAFEAVDIPIQGRST